MENKVRAALTSDLVVVLTGIIVAGLTQTVVRTEFSFNVVLLLQQGTQCIPSVIARTQNQVNILFSYMSLDPFHLSLHRENLCLASHSQGPSHMTNFVVPKQSLMHYTELIFGQIFSVLLSPNKKILGIFNHILSDGFCNMEVPKYSHPPNKIILWPQNRHFCPKIAAHSKPIMFGSSSMCASWSYDRASGLDSLHSGVLIFYSQNNQPTRTRLRKRTRVRC